MNWDAIGAVGEVLGALAVVVTLGYLAIQMRQNTAALRISNENFLIERQDAIIATLVTDPSLAALAVKHDRQEELTDVEHVRMWNQYFRDLLMWELAYNRLKEGHFSEAHWRDWDNAYSKQFVEEFPPSWWEEARPWLTDDFSDYVDALYKSRSETG